MYGKYRADVGEAQPATTPRPPIEIPHTRTKEEIERELKEWESNIKTRTITKHYLK